MKKVKVMAASVIFIVLTTVKMLLPATAYEIRSEAAALINYDDDIKSVVSLIGSRVEAYKIEAPQPVAALPEARDKKVYRPVTIDEIRSDMKALVKEKIVREEPEPLAEASAEPDPHDAAVSAFVASQQAFTDEAIPANVSCDYAELPFEFSAPVSGLSSSGFGFRLHPILNEVKFHYGTDVAANTGTAVCAFTSGTVTFAGLSDSYGYYVTIDHGDGWQTLYAHCSELLVMGGASVEKGDKIALVGSTGQATGPHLHFELSHNGVYVNPEYYVNYI